MKQYVQRVYQHKMEAMNLTLDLNGDGEVSMDEFVAVLMKDNFWNQDEPHDETHLHATTCSTAMEKTAAAVGKG